MFWNCLVGFFIVLVGGAALGVASMLWPGMVDLNSGMWLLGVLIWSGMVAARRIRRRRE
jgi:hypothetical protein